MENCKLGFIKEQKEKVKYEKEQKTGKDKKNT